MVRTRTCGVVALGLALSAMTAFASSTASAAPVSDDAKAGLASLERFLPNDTEAVVVINFKQLFESPLLKKGGALGILKELIKKNDEAQKTFTDLGFDPFTDLDTMVSAQSGEGQDKGVVVVTGKFDVAKFTKKADEVAKDKKDAVKIHSVVVGKDEYKVYEVTNLDDLVKLPGELAPLAPDSQAMFVGIDKSAVIMSASKDSVAEAMAKAAGKKKTELKNKEIQKLLAKVDAQQTVSMVILASVIARSPVGEEPQAKEVLEKLDNITGGITVGDGIKTQILLGAKDADSATAINKKVDEGLDQAQQLVAAFADLRKDLAPLLQVVKGIKVGAKDKTVTIDSEISAEVLESLGKSLGSLLKRPQ
jgi:hypothetical protein